MQPILLGSLWFVLDWFVFVSEESLSEKVCQKPVDGQGFPPAPVQFPPTKMLAAIVYM